MLTISQDSIQNITQNLKTELAEFALKYPGETSNRQPVHTVYGGAHLFKSDTALRLGKLALRDFENYASDKNEFAKIFSLPESLSTTIYNRVIEKIRDEPVEDFRIDFEDGYGIRAENEEDGHAVSAAVELAKGFVAETLPPFIGIRIKAFSEETYQRSIRTLDLFLSEFVKHTKGKLPENFVVTLPKVIIPRQIKTLIQIFELLEQKLNLPKNSLKMEMMIETTQSIINELGEINLLKLLKAAQGRCVAAHFGAYDYTASCGITVVYQDLLHPACDFARHMMQVSLGGTGIWLSDGATNILPIPKHRGELNAEQKEENKKIIQHAWRLHYDHIRYSLANGFYQGWDLHPSQLPARYAAVYAFFLEGLDSVSERLKNFIAKAAQATLVGEVFDDAATGQGLLNYFLRAINCRVLNEQEVQNLTGLTIDELRSGSFLKILQNRSK